jgi:hypothetical protein
MFVSVVLAQGDPLQLSSDFTPLKEAIEALSGTDSINALTKLIMISRGNPVTDTSSPDGLDLGYPLSPSPFTNSLASGPLISFDIWGKERNFKYLFTALTDFLQPTKV